MNWIPPYRKYKLLLAGFDFLIILVSFFLALDFGEQSRSFLDLFSSAVSSGRIFVFILGAMIIIIIFQNYNLYKFNSVIARSRQIISIMIAFFYIIITLSVLAFFLHSTFFVESRLAIGLFGLIGFLSIASFRVFIFRPLLLFFNKQEILPRRLLIVGCKAEAKNLAIHLEINNIYGLKLIGFVDGRFKKGHPIFDGYANLGGFEDIPAIVQDHNIHEILVAISDVTHEELLSVLDICKSTQVNLKVTSTIFSIIHEKVSTESYYSVPTARLLNLSERKGLLLTKRIIDIAGALLGIILLLAPSLILAVLIKTGSNGPVFYRQKRVGKNGKEFDFYKFRSMVVGSDHDSDREEKLADFIKNGNGDNTVTTKVVDEGKITSVGRFIRKTSIDELPQLFNVLKGDMSLVGPRPCLPYEYKVYDEWHKRRLSVLPGCTGLWQVSNRAKGGFDDMVLLDLYYIDNMSPWFDIQLILKTIPVMIFGRGGK